MLKKHMVTNRIHQSSEPLRLAHAALFAQNREDPGEGLLADIFDGLWGLEAGAEFELEQFRKIADKVLLRLRFTRTEILDINRIK